MNNNIQVQFFEQNTIKSNAHAFKKAGVSTHVQTAIPESSINQLGKEGNVSKKSDYNFNLKVEYKKSIIKKVRFFQKYNWFTGCLKPRLTRLQNGGKDCGLEIDYKNKIINESSLTTCKNSLCIKCSKEYNYKNTYILKNVVLNYQNIPNKSILFVTFTIPHYKNQKFSIISKIVKSAMASLLSDSEFIYNRVNPKSKKLRKMPSIQSSLSLDSIFQRYELTVSSKHGFNFHSHNLFFCNRTFTELELKSLKERIFLLWQKYVAKELQKEYQSQSDCYTTRFKARAVDLQDVSNNIDTISRYLNKSFDIASELTDTKNKLTKSKDSYSINQLYDMLYQNDFRVFSKYKLVTLINEILTTLKGKKLTQWRLTKDVVKEVIDTSKAELKQQRKDYISSLQNQPLNTDLPLGVKIILPTIKADVRSKINSKRIDFRRVNYGSLVINSIFFSKPAKNYSNMSKSLVNTGSKGVYKNSS